MNPTLLKDLILAGHRVACKYNNGMRKVFLFIDGKGDFQGTLLQYSIEECISEGLIGKSYSEEKIQEDFTGEYKIVTQLPQLPQVGDTVEVLEICRELPGFDEWHEGRRYMVGKKFEVKTVDAWGDIRLKDNEFYFFSLRQVAKCEPEKEQSIESEEKFGEVIELNGKKYREII